jgi:hypothetical protein
MQKNNSILAPEKRNLLDEADTQFEVQIEPSQGNRPLSPNVLITNSTLSLPSDTSTQPSHMTHLFGPSNYYLFAILKCVSLFKLYSGSSAAL